MNFVGLPSSCVSLPHYTLLLFPCNVEMLGTTLLHEFKIFYSHTESNLRSSLGRNSEKFFNGVKLISILILPQCCEVVCSLLVDLGSVVLAASISLRYVANKYCAYCA